MAPVGRITDKIVHHLLYSAVIVADTTGRNPNVFYEVGVAHAFRRPIVLIVDDPKSIPFDIHSEGHLILPGEGNLLGRTIEDSKDTLFRALMEALDTATTPSGPVATAQAQLAPTSLTAAEATDILREELSELSYRLRNVEATVTEHTTRPSHRSFGENLQTVALRSTPFLSETEKTVLSAILLRTVPRSRQVKEIRGLAVEPTHVTIDYIGTDQNPRQTRVEAQSGNLAATLRRLAIEFGFDETDLSKMLAELKQGGLT